MTTPKSTCSEPDCARIEYSTGLCRPHYETIRLADMPPCTIDGCERLVHVKKRGWCKSHYEAWQRHGDPLVFLGQGGPGIRRKTAKWAICQACGVTFEVKAWSHGKFCTRACFKRGIVKTCPGCGIEFRIKVSKDDKYTYCSLACRQRVAAAARVITQCEKCGEAISRAPSQARARFCSYDCMPKEQIVSAPCERCGEEFSLPAYRMKAQRFCGNRCATIARIDDGPPFGYMANKLRTGYRTDIEGMAEAALIELGVAYLFEKKVGRFLIDFALPDYGIGLECDGWFHKRTTERDAGRDAYLLERGWRIVRVVDPDLRRDALASILKAIPELLSEERYERPYEQLRLLG